MTRRGMIPITIVACLVLTSSSPPPPSFAPGGDDAHATEGLHLLENGRFERAWARPGVSFERYTGIWATFAGIPYLKDPSGTPGWARRSNYPMSAELRDTLMELLGQRFRAEIEAAENWQSASAREPGVLFARVSLIDLVLHTPLRHVGGESLAWVDSVGAFTLVVELYDSETGVLVARVAERRSIETESHRPMRAVPGATIYESNRIFRDWAKRLTSLLDGVRGANLARAPSS